MWNLFEEIYLHDVAAVVAEARKMAGGCEVEHTTSDHNLGFDAALASRNDL